MKTFVRRQLGRVPDVVEAFRLGRARLTAVRYRQDNDAVLAKLRASTHPLAAVIAMALVDEEGPAPLETGAWAAIEHERARLLASTEPLVDGSLPGRVMSGDQDISVGDAAWGSKGRPQARMIHRLVRGMRPGVALELGTNLGISSSYMALAMASDSATTEPFGTVVTMEGSAYRLRVARQVHDRLGLHHVEHVQGLFADTLPATLDDVAQRDGAVDMAFIDGHHHEEPTLEYFEQILPASSNAVFIFDDIDYSAGMRRAWTRLQADDRLGLLVDLGVVGIAVRGHDLEGERLVLPPYRMFRP